MVNKRKRKDLYNKHDKNRDNAKSRCEESKNISRSNVCRKKSIFVENNVRGAVAFFSISNHLTCCRVNILLIVICIENNSKNVAPRYKTLRRTNVPS